MCPINGYFDIPFAENGDLNTIPDPTQTNGTVSYNQGFPIGYSTPVGSGGLLVPRTAFNQVLFDITSAVQNWQQNTVAPFITPTMNGGTPYSYPANAMVLYGGNIYISLVGSNADTPPSAKWQLLAIRTRLAGDTTFYVATTGSDSNTGLSAGSPWLTLQHAWDAICSQYDLAQYTATIQVADGTYAALQTTIGAVGGAIVLNGNAATPSNVIISASGGSGALSFNSQRSPITATVKNLEVVNSGGNGISASNGTNLTIGAGLIFGACSLSQVSCNNGAKIFMTSGYTIGGGAANHWFASDTSFIAATGITITLTGTPAFSGSFAATQGCSSLECFGNTFTGTATGKRYSAIGVSFINSNGGGASYLPGSVAGTLASGGQYA